MNNENYLNNPNLFKAHTQQQYTEEQIREIAKCMDRPYLFYQNIYKDCKYR